MDAARSRSECASFSAAASVLTPGPAPGRLSRLSLAPAANSQRCSLAGVATDAVGTTHAPLVTDPTQKRAGADSSMRLYPVTASEHCASACAFRFGVGPSLLPGEGCGYTASHSNFCPASNSAVSIRGLDGQFQLPPPRSPISRQLLARKLAPPSPGKV